MLLFFSSRNSFDSIPFKKAKFNEVFSGEYIPLLFKKIILLLLLRI